MPQLIANETDIIRAREALAFASGALDAKRPTAWAMYGYHDVVPFPLLLQAYERGGAANGAVHRILEKCWEQLPRIKRPDTDDETPWERKTGAVLRAVKAWAKLRDFDRRNMIGRYAGLIYRVADGLALREPLQRASKLVDLVPVYEDQLKVVAWHADPADTERYGKPAMFQYRARRPGQHDTQGQPDEWQDVHPSRVQIMAEGSVGDMFDGVPLLRAGFNTLADIEKISGGSAESYLKNSARTLVFEYERDASLQAIGPDGQQMSVREVHSQQTRELNRNLDASIVLQGGKANTLQTSVADPTKPFEVAANLFAASVRLPSTVLFGQQTGRLASDEDRADYAARCKGRQTNELTPMLEEFIQRMQAAGIIEAGDFEIEWQDLSAPTDSDKLKHAREMAAINKEVFGSGGSGELPFDGEEIRRAAGYEEREPLPGGEGGAPEEV